MHTGSLLCCTTGDIGNHFYQHFLLGEGMCKNENKMNGMEFLPYWTNVFRGKARGQYVDILFAIGRIEHLEANKINRSNSYYRFSLLISSLSLIAEF